jgi:hypothetical protein
MFLFSFWICCLSFQAQQMSYKALWQQIEKYDKADLPKSALRVTNQIRKKAKLKKNTDQWLASSLRRIHYLVYTDKWYKDVIDLEEEVEKAKEPIKKAFLHLFLADIYATYYNDYSSSVTERFLVNDTIKDLRLLGRDNFLHKIKDHLYQALKDKEILRKVSTAKYPTLIGQASMSRFFGHDMYHFIAFNAIRVYESPKDYWFFSSVDNVYKEMDDLSFLSTPIPLRFKYDFEHEVLRIYQELLQYYAEKKNDEAYLQTELERLPDYNTVVKSKKIFSNLKELTKRFADSKSVVKAYARLIKWYSNNENPKKATELMNYCLKHYKGNPYLTQIFNLKKNITRPDFELKLNDIDAFHPFSVNLKYKDIRDVTLTLRRVHLSGNDRKLNRYFELKKRKTFIQKHTTLYLRERWHLKATPTHEYVTEKKIYSTLSPGIYTVKVSTPVKGIPTERKLIYVSNLKLLRCNYPNDSTTYIVVHAKTGHPIENATIEIKYRNKKRICLKTNVRGEVKVGNSREIVSTFAFTATDKFMEPFESGWRFDEYIPVNHHLRQERIYTDRAIYRPGQTVHVAGWCYQGWANQRKVIPNTEVKVILYDTQREKIAEKKVKTNEYGSYALDFSLPKKILTGHFLLATEFAETSICVEEYKRPTFAVNIFPVEKKDLLGDTMKIKGNVVRYSGVPVQNAKVQVVVTLKNGPFWMKIHKKTWKIEERTNEKGDFVALIYPNTLKRYIRNKYKSFSIKAIVTDITGEITQNEIRVPIVKEEIILSMNLPKAICKETLNSKMIKAVNWSNIPEAIKGSYSIYSLRGEKIWDDLGEVKTFNKEVMLKRTNDCLLTQPFESNHPLDMLLWSVLPSGVYRIVISGKDKTGNEVNKAYDFVYYSLQDKQVPLEVVNWFQVISDKYSKHHPAEIVLGTKEKDVFVYCQMTANNCDLGSTYFTLSNEVKRIKIPYQEAYSGKVFVNYLFVKEGKFYKNSVMLVEEEKKQQQLKWSSFRNHLKPGQKETWELEVLSPEGEKAETEVLATMYDMSLDQFALKHDLEYNSKRIMGRNIKYFLSEKETVYWEMNRKHFYLTTRYFSDEPLEKRDYLYFPGDKDYKFMSLEYIRNPECLIFCCVEETEEEKENEKKIVSSPLKLRDNFSETAFFYPHLRTDKGGKVRISFTLPDVLTTWKFIALSHSKTMDYGRIVDYVTAQKDFMIVPHVPRFVREGDEVVLSSSLMNLCTKRVEGKVVLEIFNPATEEVLLTKEKDFDSKTGQTQPIDFHFKLSGEIPLLAFRIKAITDEYSDGEQHYLPVLSRKQKVVQGLPLVNTKIGRKKYDLSRLFNGYSPTATQRKLSIELAANPYWTAIQALPALSEPQYNNAIDLAAAYYANKMSSAIISIHPRIAQVIKTWQFAGENKSPLSLKEDLKQILLEESPWVQASSAASTALALQGMLLNENEMQQRNKLLIDKLSSLQNDEGGFSWFSGMPSDPYITIQVLHILSRLSVIQGVPLDKKMNHLLNKAQRYFSRYVVLPWYKRSKKPHYEGLSFYEKELLVNYLYVLSLRKPQNATEKRLLKHYIYRELPQITEFTIFGKAVANFVLRKFGLHSTAKKMYSSIREYSITAPDKGSYFETPDVSLIRQYSIPRQVAVMEMAQRYGDTVWVEQLGLWLLLQKQVKQWSSSLSTVNAIYALTHLLPTKSVQNKVELTYGKCQLTPSSDVLGSIKKELREKEILSSTVPLIINQEKEGIVYGGVYTECFEDVDKVKATSGALKLVCSYYKSILVAGGKELVPITDKTVLHKGDEVICRMQIHCDNNFDYLQLKVNKAACLEIDTPLSGYCYQQGMGYYCAPRDASTNYFFNSLNKGVYVLETAYHVVREGVYETGVSILQSAYNPNFISHSPSMKLRVK